MTDQVMSAIEQPSVTDARYNALLRMLHWLMAAGFFLMLESGAVMEHAGISSQLKFEMFQWHKSGGVLLLLAACARLTAFGLFSTPEDPA